MRKILFLFIKKFLSYLLTLFILVSVIFFLIRVTPGDPVSKYISPGLSRELAENVRSSFHLDQPLINQYLAFVSNMATGDFGVSYEYHQPVFKVIKEFLPFTIIFALISFSIQFITGLWIAIYSVKKNNPFLEKIGDTTALTIYSMPTFLIGIFLIYVFSLLLNLFPSADLYSTGFNQKSFFEQFYEILSHSILPMITLTLPGIVVFYRYSKENIKATLEMSFIRYLYANGLEEKKIYIKHIIPNILPQIISLSVVELSILLSGALITEVLFNLPGIGRITVTAILQRDYPLIVASTLLAGVFIVVCSFFGDIIRGIIDKRLIKEVYS